MQYHDLEAEADYRRGDLLRTARSARARRQRPTRWWRFGGGDVRRPTDARRDRD
ncbi:hypothetical protein [Egicoccus sp. AB-alg2]|uniref:hypothetical protein n=1 Tax=Egicoccus sp. AB-alg2 TaxID=3242693 RepID=UPI00359CE9CA